jgi:hypothetical protein
MDSGYSALGNNIEKKGQESGVICTVVYLSNPSLPFFENVIVYFAVSYP